MKKKFSFNSRLQKMLLSFILLTLISLVACSSGGDATDSAGETGPDSIQNIVWQWTSVTEQSTGNETTVPLPRLYTIIFNTDGIVTGEADCNAFSGTYSQENGFSITLGPSTLAACGEDSLDQVYLGLLSSVAAGGPDGSGGLALETAGGAERMLFQNGGAVPGS